MQSGRGIKVTNFQKVFLISSNIQKNEYCERDYLMAHYNIIKLTHTFNESTLIIFNAALLKAGKYRYKSFF